MGWVPGCPQDPGVYHGPLAPIAVVLHRTYGAWPGDYSVGKQGIFHILLGKDEGRWAQFAPTEIVQWHCNGANGKAFGVEIEGTNDEPLTDWQAARLGDVLRYARDAHGIPLDYLDPDSVPRASVHVNDGTFRGVISHCSVQTDDGSSQHGDFITVADYQRAVGTTPTPAKGKKKPMDMVTRFGLGPDDVYLTDWQTKRKITPKEQAMWKYFGGQVRSIDQEIFDSIPDVKK